MADLANVFSWSRSRAGMFEECRRRYYYHYYGAWGGWDSNAPPDIRRLYVLKQLTGRQGWAGPHRPLRGGARAPGAARGRGAVRGSPDRGHGAADARRMAVLPPRGLPRAAEGSGRPLRARVRRRGDGPGLADPARPRLPVPPQLSPAAAPRGHPEHAARALDPHRGHPRLRVRGHAHLRGARLRLLDAGGPAGAGRLEDREPGSGRDRDPARRIRALRAGHPGRGARARRPPGGEPARRRGHRCTRGTRRGSTRSASGSGSRSAA